VFWQIECSLEENSFSSYIKSS